MSSSLIGSLLQSSCLFISRPVNNLPDSISVTLHLSFTLSPFPHHDFLIKGSSLISFLRYALTGIFPASHPPLICLWYLLQPTYFSLLFAISTLGKSPKSASQPQLFQPFSFHGGRGAERSGSVIKYGKAWRGGGGGVKTWGQKMQRMKMGGRGSCWCTAVTDLLWRLWPPTPRPHFVLG